MQEVKISLQIGEITHEIGEKNNTGSQSDIMQRTGTRIGVYSHSNSIFA